MGNRNGATRKEIQTFAKSKNVLRCKQLCQELEQAAVRSDTVKFWDLVA